MYDPAVNLAPARAEPACTGRIRKAKARVIDTRPGMDLENAVLLTESFRETEGEPLVIRKAKAFRKQIPWQHSSLIGKDFYLASTFEEVRPGPGPGSLKIESVPSGAEVKIDGTYYGKTPVSTRDLAPGKVRVRVSLSGHRDEEKVIEVASGRRKRVSFVLDEIVRTGRLYVNPEPSDARIRVMNIGPAYRRGMELDPGRYQLEVSRDGYETDERWVTLAAGEDLEIDVSLNRNVAVGPRVIDRDGRFVAYDDGTVLDTESGLMWAAKDNGEDIDWHDAKAYCEKYRGGGHRDWRMPTLDELEGIYEATQIIKIGWWVWASEIKSDGSSAAYFTFLDGFRVWGPPSGSYGLRALPVRRGN